MSTAPWCPVCGLYGNTDCRGHACRHSPLEARIDDQYGWKRSGEIIDRFARAAVEAEPDWPHSKARGYINRQLARRSAA